MFEGEYWLCEVLDLFHPRINNMKQNSPRNIQISLPLYVEYHFYYRSHYGFRYISESPFLSFYTKVSNCNFITNRSCYWFEYYYFLILTIVYTQKNKSPLLQTYYWSWIFRLIYSRKEKVMLLSPFCVYT